jgi:hypothetical protein
MRYWRLHEKDEISNSCFRYVGKKGPQIARFSTPDLIISGS